MLYKALLSHYLGLLKGRIIRKYLCGKYFEVDPFGADYVAFLLLIKFKFGIKFTGKIL